MNILYLTNHLNIGGITTYVLTLAAGLKRRGHKIYIASSGGELLPKIIEEGIGYIHIPIRTKSEASPKILLSYFKLKRFLKQNQISILHVNSRTTQVLGCWLNRKTGIPYISTCHGFFKTRFSRRIFPCWGQKIIAISEEVKRHLLRDFKVSEKNIALIYNGVDIEKFKIQNSKFKINLKKNLGLCDNPIIGIVARLSDVKGHIYLIQAMKTVLDSAKETQLLEGSENFPPLHPEEQIRFAQCKLRDEGSHEILRLDRKCQGSDEPSGENRKKDSLRAQLLIVGKGKMKQDLVNLIRTLEIEKNVHFLPAVSDTRMVLSVMDVFVMPSLKEGLSFALMEAMAQGVAVIGSDVGGIRSLIKDGYNGLLVKPANSDSLAKAIRELLNSNQKRKSLADNARIFIKENFSQEKMVSETEEVYLECLRR
jgi:glycosyltransferase involved in cell wall biosynthesis